MGTGGRKSLLASISYSGTTGALRRWSAIRLFTGNAGLMSILASNDWAGAGKLKCESAIISGVGIAGAHFSAGKQMFVGQHGALRIGPAITAWMGGAALRRERVGDYPLGNGAGLDSTLAIDTNQGTGALISTSANKSAEGNAGVLECTLADDYPLGNAGHSIPSRHS